MRAPPSNLIRKWLCLEATCAFTQALYRLENMSQNRHNTHHAGIASVAGF
jgi:hypothetical protein